MSRAVPVILAGGSGTRLWPLSRDAFPKQFQSFGWTNSFLQQTLLRFAGAAYAPALIVCNEEYRFLAREQAESIGCGDAAFILEPAGRNTAPALTVAALLLRDADPVLLIAPADHFIPDHDAFRRCLDIARADAEGGAIVTIGIRPTRPETGYGYIRARQGAASAAVHEVASFVEKPDRERAEAYIASGDHYWNSGMFIVRASVWLEAIRRYRADIHDACLEGVRDGAQDGSFFRPQREAFLRSPSDSIDYAVMERAAGGGEFRCRVVPYAGEWSDVGSWRSIRETGTRDTAGNVTTGDVLNIDSFDSVVLSQERLVAVLGCRNIVVAETADAVLVADLDASQSLSGLVQELKRSGRSEALTHRRVYRPWGSYESVAQGAGYQVKRLTIAPGRKLSLQLHRQRAEHWVVVKGLATVVRGEETVQLRENESIYIPPHTRHRIGNDQDSELEIIEVQTGSYLGEDDIERFADDFGRAPGAPA